MKILLFIISSFLLLPSFSQSSFEIGSGYLSQNGGFYNNVPTFEIGYKSSFALSNHFAFKTGLTMMYYQDKKGFSTSNDYYGNDFVIDSTIAYSDYGLNKTITGMIPILIEYNFNKIHVYIGGNIGFNILKFRDIVELETNTTTTDPMKIMTQTVTKKRDYFYNPSFLKKSEYYYLEMGISHDFTDQLSLGLSIGSSNVNTYGILKCAYQFKKNKK